MNNCVSAQHCYNTISQYWTFLAVSPGISFIVIPHISCQRPAWFLASARISNYYRYNWRLYIQWQSRVQNASRWGDKWDCLRILMLGVQTDEINKRERTVEYFAITIPVYKNLNFGLLRRRLLVTCNMIFLTRPAILLDLILNLLPSFTTFPSTLDLTWSSTLEVYSNSRCILRSRKLGWRQLLTREQTRCHKFLLWIYTASGIARMSLGGFFRFISKKTWCIVCRVSLRSRCYRQLISVWFKKASHC